MNESIRSVLKRRVRWCMAIGIGGWLLIATSVSARIDNPAIQVAGFLIFGGAILTLQWVIKCPRCSVRLGQLAMTLGVPGLKPQPNFCPYCGVSLDEPRSPRASVAQATPFNPIR
jgi:hypothetical protein